MRYTTKDMDDAPRSEQEQKGGVGPFVGIIIVVVLVALGGLYLVLQEIKLHQTPTPENVPAQTGQESS